MHRLVSALRVAVIIIGDDIILDNDVTIIKIVISLLKITTQVEAQDHEYYNMSNIT